MARGSSLTVRVRIDGLRETLAKVSRLGANANEALRERVDQVSRRLAHQIEAAGSAEGSQAGLVAGTVKVARDRVPSIQVGGTARVGSRRKPAYKLLFGSEFGSNFLHQYKPHVGQDSYWVFRTVDLHQPETERAWLAAADDVIRAFGGV